MLANQDHPILRNCPLCLCDVPESLYFEHDDMYQIECPHCRLHRLSWEASVNLRTEHNDLRTKLMYCVRKIAERPITVSTCGQEYNLAYKDIYNRIVNVRVY